MSAEETANKFNDFINARDISGLSDMMTDDHIFIDTVSKLTAGKENCVKAWEEFFNAFPDYRNHFTKFTTKGKFVIIEGHSTSSEKLLEGLRYGQLELTATKFLCGVFIRIMKKTEEPLNYKLSFIPSCEAENPSFS